MNKWEKEVHSSLLRSEASAIKEIEKQYQAALNSIMDQVKAFSDSIDMLDQALLDQTLSQEQKDVLLSMKQSKIYQKQYQEALQGQVSGILDKMHSDNYKTIEEYLKATYTDSFVGTMYDIGKQGIPLIFPIDQNAFVRAVLTDSKVSNGLYTALGVDVKNLKKSITHEISRGISSGMSYTKIAQNLSNTTLAPLKRTKTIVRTEGHRIQQASINDAQHRAKDKGADVVKQWDATLDGKTRPTHRLLDGQIQEIDDPFKADGYKVDRPGYFGDPSQDCNCRCSCLTRARWALDDAELKILKDRANYYQLDKTKDFDDFEKKYLQTVEKIQQPVSKKITFTKAETIEEAEEFVKKFCDTSVFGSVGVSYQGVNLDVANEINETINRFYSLFNVPKLGGIAAPAKNTKLGKMINSHAAYSPVRRSLLLDRNKTKNAKTMVSALLEDQKAIQDLLSHPEKYDFNKLSIRVRNVVEASKKTGRSIVPETIGESINHELGHFLEHSISKEDFEFIKLGMNEYADGISGYATDSISEYVAESFASYMKGEDRIDPKVRKIFDALRKE